MPVSVQIILVISAIAGLAYTVGKALSSAQKKDLLKLERSIDELKVAQKETADRIGASQKEFFNRIEASQKEFADRLEDKIDSSISTLNAKFDRYLFGKLEKTKTDDSPK